MSFWDTYDDRPVDVKPGYEALVPREACVPELAQPALEPAAPAPSPQNDLSGVCDWCGIASDDVLLGVCSDCV